MKIPETQSNVGAYYGNEENGQWQANGVIIDSGVGGGVVGSGDAGVHRPPVYPVHIPRGHIPSYVMAGAYYPPAFPPGPAPPDDFADYMWMENEEEFDKQVMQQLEEEALMEQCIEAMLEDEQRERHRPVANGHSHYPTSSNGLSLEEAVSRSTLNPLAAEFVPGRASQSNAEEKVEQTDEKREETEEVINQKEEVQVQSETVASEEVKEESKTEEIVPPQTDPPEVSAADVQPIDTEKKTIKKDTKKPEVKKITKTEVKPKVKALAVKSDTKVQKKKEVKVVKSEVTLEESEDVIPQVEEIHPSPVEDSTPAIKPINYAAAAKANKPKKPSTPPATEKITPSKLDKPKPEKIEKKPQTKDKVKVDKPVTQRKNSTK